MKIIIFGATGSIGRHLVGQALSQGHRVTAFARKPSALKLDCPELTRQAGDVLDGDTVNSAVEGHDAVLIATGVYKARDIKVPGVGLGNIVPALDYLIASNRKGLGLAVPEFDDGRLDAGARKVVVLGAGDTAMDCVRTAVRQGAEVVICLYRRDKANMPGSQHEVQHAEEEGVNFMLLAAPEAFLGNETVSAVRAARVHLGVADSSGRQTPEIIEGSSFNIESDLVIKALGFDPEDIPTLLGAPELALTDWGTIKIDYATLMTNLDGVFAAGDIVRGASLVVWAIRDGRDAAASIDRYITAQAAGRASGREAAAA